MFSTVTALVDFGAESDVFGPDFATLAPWENALEMITRDTTQLLRKYESFFTTDLLDTVRPSDWSRK
jgi:hypothetical protein